MNAQASHSVLYTPVLFRNRPAAGALQFGPITHTYSAISWGSDGSSSPVVATIADQSGANDTPITGKTSIQVNAAPVRLTPALSSDQPFLDGIDRTTTPATIATSPGTQIELSDFMNTFTDTTIASQKLIAVLYVAAPANPLPPPGGELLSVNLLSATLSSFSGPDVSLSNPDFSISGELHPAGSAVPEPSALVLTLMGVPLGVLILRRSGGVSRRRIVATTLHHWGEIVDASGHNSLGPCRIRVREFRMIVDWRPTSDAPAHSALLKATDSNSSSRTAGSTGLTRW
jgi:hypothetical protein